MMHNGSGHSCASGNYKRKNKNVFSPTTRSRRSHSTKSSTFPSNVCIRCISSSPSQVIPSISSYVIHIAQYDDMCVRGETLSVTLTKCAYNPLRVAHSEFIYFHSIIHSTAVALQPSPCSQSRTIRAMQLKMIRIPSAANESKRTSVTVVSDVIGKETANSHTFASRRCRCGQQKSFFNRFNFQCRSRIPVCQIIILLYLLFAPRRSLNKIN